MNEIILKFLKSNQLYLFCKKINKFSPFSGGKILDYYENFPPVLESVINFSVPRIVFKL